MFSNLSSSSISLATVTPSLVMRGAPNDLSSTTFRPFGPRVTRTALARMSIPCSIFSRASSENFTSLAAMLVPAFDLRGHAFGGTKTRPKCGHPKARQQRANLLVSQQSKALTVINWEEEEDGPSSAANHIS